MMTPTGYTVDFIDSDNDGLYDYIEDAVGTDKNLSDTDNDDLTDYEEVYLLGTDPVVYDSIVSGTSDGDADPDNDGLSNRYELDNGTNTLCDDTDSDGLTDGEEIGTYGTDPVKYDTDEDNIGDGDEITLGLNPLDSSTDESTQSLLFIEFSGLKITHFRQKKQDSRTYFQNNRAKCCFSHFYSPNLHRRFSTNPIELLWHKFSNVIELDLFFIQKPPFSDHERQIHRPDRTDVRLSPRRVLGAGWRAAILRHSFDGADQAVRYAAQDYLPAQDLATDQSRQANVQRGYGQGRLPRLV